MKKLVLIVSSFYEPNVNLVVEKLRKKRIRWLRFNTEFFPLVVNGTWKLNYGADLSTSFNFENQSINTEEITSVWNRRTGKFILPDSFTEQEEKFAIGECNTFLRALYSSIDSHWVNSNEAEIKANVKPYQLLVARQIGLKVPVTLITNDPKEALSFYNSSKSKIIFKPLGGGSVKTIDYSQEIYNTFPSKFIVKPHVSKPTNNYQFLFTQILDEEKLKKIESVKLSPLIFQEYIDKKYELRITVIGERIFACAIYSQQFIETSVDFRRFSILEDQVPKHEKVVLPLDIQEKILKLMKQLNLVFACIDMIVTLEGEYVFLEVNPSGQWLWIEDLTGYKITDALVDNLIQWKFSNSPTFVGFLHQQIFCHVASLKGPSMIGFKIKRWGGVFIS